MITPQKLCLIILDGFGINNTSDEENSIVQAHSPLFEKLFSQKFTSLGASGNYVGLPEGQIGNSEVGHLTIGSGRILFQSSVKMSKLFTEKSFEKLDAFQKGVFHAQKNKSTLHLFQLLGSGGVHAIGEHLKEILKIIPRDIAVSLHLFMDGRDLEPKSGLQFLQDCEKYILDFSNVSIASLGGRYYGMDRDNNWERIEKAYHAIIGKGESTHLCPSAYVQEQYAKGIFDEFIEPISFEGKKYIRENDVIFHLNFRSDRARQITQVFCDDNFVGFGREKIKNVYFVSATKYYPDSIVDVFIGDDNLNNVLSQILSEHGLSQLHLAETEKFAHVTKFFNGGNYHPFPGEDWKLVPSHKVATYDLDPAMSAIEIKDVFQEIGANYAFSVINFANGDMLGHTGNLSVAVESIQFLDKIIQDIITFCHLHNIDILITADHGNCEEMGTKDAPKTAHTLNPVPCWYISHTQVQAMKTHGGLADIAPTVLDIMGLSIPEEMTGKSLLF